MPNRIIKESICESRALADISFFSEDLYKRLITYADDYGRFNADPQIMLARLYPRELDVVTSNELITGLIELSGVGKIAFYTGPSIHEREIFGCFPKWGEHQRVRDSKKRCPDPTDTNVNDWYLRRFVPISMKIELLQRDDFSCAECGKKIAETDNARALIKYGAGLFHIDHIVPVGQGGRATMENLRILCPKCNLSRKRKFTFDEILQFAESCGNLPKIAETSGINRLNPIQSLSESLSESNAMIADDEARKIQSEQNRVMNAAADAGFKIGNTVMANLIRLYAEYGLDRMLAGIDSCAKHGAPNLAYLEACLKGEPRKKKAKVNAQDFPQRDYTDADARLMDELKRDMEEFKGVAG